MPNAKSITTFISKLYSEINGLSCMTLLLLDGTKGFSVVLHQLLAGSAQQGRLPTLARLSVMRGRPNTLCCRETQNVYLSHHMCLKDTRSNRDFLTRQPYLGGAILRHISAKANRKSLTR